MSAYRVIVIQPTSKRKQAAIVALGLILSVLVALGAYLQIARAQADQRVAYGFNEGSSTAITDASSNNTPGTATSPTWTTSGRYGNGIVFNGSSSRVRSNTTVGLNGAFTFSAWINNPTTQNYETVMTVGSNRDLYLVNGVPTYWNGGADFSFGPALTNNTWHYVSLVSDGSTVRLYVNGVQRGTAQNVTTAAVTDSLQIGAWISGSSNFDYFSGTIDEVRLHNRALTASEITADMNEAVGGGGGGGDTTAPSLSAGAPSGSLAAGTTTANLQVTTSENATCRYSTTANTAYSAMTNTFTTTGSTTHSSTVTGLTNSTSYTYYARCIDGSNNANAADYSISFSVAAPAAPAQLGNWSATTSLPSARSANGAVHANGYMYLIGGIDGAGSNTATVSYAAVNSSDGSIAAWNTTTPLPTALRSVRPAYHNGYLYVAGGNDLSNLTSTVYYAPVNPDGTVGTWNTTTAMPQAQLSHATVAHNGYLYIVGGNPEPCVGTVRVAPINANGTLGNWNTTSALPAARCGIVEAATVYNGYMYVVGGYDNGGLTNTVYYAQMNADGTLGAWQTNGTTLTTAREYHAIEAANGYLFVIAGQAGILDNVTASVEEAPINANGSVGNFTASTNLPAPRGYLATELANGRIYALGGGTDISGGTAQSTVYVAQVAGTSDTTAPSLSAGAPSGSLAAGTTTANLQVTTSENATCRYSTTANTAYSAMTSTFTTTGGTAHSTSLTGLTNGSSYSYYVRCIDGASNANIADYTVSFSVAMPDATAPTVAITAPADGASVSGSLNITANAADNIGVSGVQFLLDGNNLGTEDTAAPYSVSWNSGTAANGAHVLTARARDAASNQTTSAAINVTVNNTSPTDQRVAYGFSEGSGTAISDASGNNTNATATSPSWANPGRYGNGITFDGTSSRVRSASTVALNGSFTMEAWVFNPVNNMYETIMTVGDNRDLYLLNGVPNLWTGGSTYSFGPALPTNAWYHVALVSDGTTVRLYVNGTQQGTTQNANLGSYMGNLQIGAWISGSNNFDFFSGQIDEVRLYNRALSQSEVQADLNAPVTSGPDTAAPSLSGGSPSGSLMAGIVQTTMQVTSNENATCRYSTTANTAYSAMTSTFTTTGGTAHSTTISGLSNGTSYTYYVRCVDTASNANATDYAISFSVANPSTGGNDFSLRFNGNGINDIDRVKIPLTTNRTVDVATDFTLEWWMRPSGSNSTGTCRSGATSGVEWIYGRIILDRDIFGNGDNGDYGISLFGDGRLSFGVARGATGATMCSSTAVNLYDNAWHHIAATRNSTSGQMCIYIDGMQRGCAAGPTGDVSYRDARATGYPNSDPFLVIGAEKHDAGLPGDYPAYIGWFDEFRVSNNVRYTANFTVPNSEFSADTNTVALYHADEGSGTVFGDTTGNNNGTLMVGGSPAGPLWDAATRPF